MTGPATGIGWSRRVAALLAGREPVPAGFGGRLDGGERVLAHGAGRGGRVVLATDQGLWVDDERTPWHRITHARWEGGALEIVVADEVEALAGGVVVLADRGPWRVVLPEPGAVPATVAQRVTGSIRTRERVELPGGGGAWFVQRRVGSRVQTQVRADADADPALVRELAAGVGERLAAVESARP